MGAAASVPSLVELVPGAALLPTALVGALESGATVREVVAGGVLLRQRAVVDSLVVLVAGRIATLVDFTGAAIWSLRRPSSGAGSSVGRDCVSRAGRARRSGQTRTRRW